MHFKGTLYTPNTNDIINIINYNYIDSKKQNKNKIKIKNNFKILKKVFTNNKTCDTIKSQTKKKQKRKGDMIMLNQIVLVGRLVQDLEIKELENGKKVSEITLAISRSYKNSDGIYETDFIHCIVWNGIAENTAEFCRKGDIIGVKGRLQRLSGDELQIVAEKVTILSSKKEE